jgi:hypothetical protein
MQNRRGLQLLVSIRTCSWGVTMATTTLLLQHHHHHEPHKRQAEEETSSCDGSDVSSRHPPSPPTPILPRGSHQNNDNLVVTCDNLRPPSTVEPPRLPRTSCSDEDDCCSNNDDEDELLSVGSETPPPVMPITDHLIGLASPSTRVGAGREDDDDEDSDAKTEIGSASQSSDSCSRSSVSRCSLMTDCYSTSSSMTSPIPPAINAAKFVPSSPEDLLHGHPNLSTQHLHHSPNIFRRQMYRPQQQASQLIHSSSVASRPNNNVNNVSNNVSMRALKFSIDNILKPDFGRQTTPIYNIPNPKKGSSGGTLLSIRSSSSAGVQDVSTRKISTSKRNGVANGSNGKHGASADKVGSKNRSNGGALPMDLSKVVSPVGSSSDGRESSSASEGTASAVNSPAAAGSAAGTLPGSPQLLWPAWVYCTRYSDRPSSGK